jgi:hypothetical protein
MWRQSVRKEKRGRGGTGGALHARMARARGGGGSHSSPLADKVAALLGEVSPCREPPLAICPGAAERIGMIQQLLYFAGIER